MTDRNWPLVAPGVWLDVRIGRRTEPCPVLFLDRDGVIVEDNGFLCDPGEARLLPGAAGMIAAANRAAIPVAVVTNQSGIDRGLYGWAEFAAVQARIEQLLAVEGAAIDALAACPFHPEHTAGYGPLHSEWRKPEAAMLTTLAAGIGGDTARSWLIGDRDSDVQAARGAGLAGAVHLAQGGGATADTAGAFSLHTAASVAGAAAVLNHVGLVKNPLA